MIKTSLADRGVRDARIWRELYCRTVVIMEWTKPSFEEICLNCEINSYASAKL